MAGWRGRSACCWQPADWMSSRSFPACAMLVGWSVVEASRRGGAWRDWPFGWLGTKLLGAMGLEGRARFADRFRHETMTAQLRSLYERLLDRPGQG